MGKRHFIKQDMQMANKYMKYVNIIRIKEM